MSQRRLPRIVLLCLIGGALLAIALILAASYRTPSSAYGAGTDILLLPSEPIASPYEGQRATHKDSGLPIRFHDGHWVADR